MTDTNPLRPHIKKTRARLKTMKHVDAKDLALHTMLPLFEVFTSFLDQIIENVDHNFTQVFETLAVANDGHFMTSTHRLVSDLSQLVDAIMVSCGYFIPNPDESVGGFIPGEDCPKEILEKIQELQIRSIQWFEQFAEVQKLADEDSEDDYDEDEDDEGDDEDEPPEVGQDGGSRADGNEPPEVGQDDGLADLKKVEETRAYPQVEGDNA